MIKPQQFIFNYKFSIHVYHDFLRKMLLIYEKHPPFACIYTNSFPLIRESYAFIHECFALIRESFTLFRVSNALFRESFAFHRESFALICESFALICESFALICESYALIREKYNFCLYENEPNRLSHFLIPTYTSYCVLSIA